MLAAARAFNGTGVPASRDRWSGHPRPPTGARVLAENLRPRCGRVDSGGVDGPDVGEVPPELTMVSARRTGHDGLMQVISPVRTRGSRARLSIVAGFVVGGILLGGAVVLGFLTLGTSFLGRFTPSGRAEPIQIATGVIAWTFALTAPALFGLVGIVRLATVLDDVTSRPRLGPAMRLTATLDDDFVVASRPRLPDGRTVPELVIGPFGAAIVAELPPAGASRHRGASWEVRRPDGRWAPMENPLDRASRDAERVRRWFGDDDSDHIVKVFAAVVAPVGTDLERTPTCAVIAPDQVPAWLASLPAQRSLSPSRRERLVEIIRAAV